MEAAEVEDDCTLPLALEDDLVEDDPIVKEIPVYLSKTLAENLYIVQYPAYMKNGCTNATFSKTFVKPENQKIRAELAIDTTNKQSYDDSMGKQFAVNTDERSTENDGEKTFDSGLMDKIVLTSERTLSHCSNFAAGIFQDGELHLTPLKAMLHMKLQCDYLDENEKHVRDGTKGAGEDDNEEEDKATSVKVKFARHLSDNLKKLQEQSFQHHYKKSQEESWILTNYTPVYDTQAESTRMEMFCPTEDSINSLNLAKENYLDQLVPQLPEKCYSESTIVNQTDLHYVRTLTLQEQIKRIMKQVKVVSFKRLCEILPPKQDTQLILKYLQQVAMLVQGNWVVNSELIYTKENKEDKFPEIMCNARDTILLSFTKHLFLKRNMISSVVKLSPEEISEIFEDLGTTVSKKGWQLKEPPDWDFCNKFTDIVQRQERFWEAKRKHRETMEAQNQPPQRQRRKSNRESLGSENEERNVGRGRKSVKEPSLSDNDGAMTEPAKHKKSRSRKISETTT
ncbi:PREDICTED: DNA-directed RNA polymerase III subunit RPC5 isoform X2 [Vollenhovia emeryi]|uniref:DNA-directed RNA polymerase III subunit RPC5 isoform X2 n=1 Tax=Vollenhovia emeryi TaxID=411798 RepID=UPI0005F5854C|nr:PREDICTED: DNA-directed RNA polymerase III subunit RPC5 isoform X2 [Vollenhovia emeryi]